MVLAHAGHWATSLLYLAPVALVALFLGVDRRRHPLPPSPDEPPEPSLDDIMDGKQ